MSFLSKLFKKRQKSAGSEQSRPTVTETATKKDEGGLGKGGYLTFDGASHGTIFINWSETPVSNAYAYFKPQKTVPSFKYKDKGGKSEIMRNLMEDKKKYYESWCHFFKMAEEFDGDCVVLREAQNAPLGISVYFLFGSTVIHLEPGKTVSSKGTSCIACIPHGNSALSVKSMHRDSFLGKGREIGGAIAL